MVDNDVFRRNVAKGFRRASRAVFDRSDPQGGLDRALYSGSVALKAGGCPGLDEIVAVISQHVEGAATEGGMEQTLAALDDIARAHAHPRTRGAVREAKAFVGSRSDGDVVAFGTTSALPQQLTERIVVAFLDGQLFRHR